MLRSWMGSLVVVSLSLISFGCQGNGLKTENANLRQENQQLKTRLAESENAQRSAPTAEQLKAMQNEIAQREQRIRELENQLRAGATDGKADPGIAGIETSYDRKKGELTVNLPADILFASGSAELKSSSRATLEKVVTALRKDYAGKKIRVEGHTDRDPIVRTKQQWLDNLDLSLNRAAAVSRYLMDKGVDKKNVATVGYGDATPKSTKAASRRVEIVVVVG